MKIKEVKTQITETVGTALVFDMNINEVRETDFSIKQSFKTTDGMEKVVREFLKGYNLSLIKINHCERVKVTYSIPIDTFMEYATPVERVGGLSPLD